MQSNTVPTTTDSERESLRALIEQKTKEYEAENGKIETLDIVKKDGSGSVWERTSKLNTVGADAQSAINKEIIERYPGAECTAALAKELGLPNETSLVKRASRLKVKRKVVNHPNIARANKRMQKVGELLGDGKPVKEIAEKLQLPERSVRYYRQRLAEINKAADAVEKKIDNIEALIK